MKKIAVIIFSFTLLYSCADKPVTDFSDYGKYLEAGIKNSVLEQIEADRVFWQGRSEENPEGVTAISKLAGILAARFGYTGKMEDLRKSDSLYQLANRLNSVHSSGTYRALAANGITQHRFQQAQMYIDSALVKGDDKLLSILMEFDVAMELGNYPRANQALKNVANKYSFDYLIRASKYSDQVEGDLDKAIGQMEKAWKSLPANPPAAVLVWVKSNLGDMYGHANRYQGAYQSYLEALAANPHDYHSLKGIAWLAFSHDNNAGAAKKILHYLKQQHPVPDYDLMLMEIAAFENDSISRKKYRDNFLSAVKDGMYGDMYNKYLFKLLAEELNDAESAFAIAEQEVKNRPSPEVFGWLAWAYCKKGDLHNALQTAGWNVERKCFEPGVIYYVGRIYLAAGNKSMARKYLAEAGMSAYELGPETSAEIKKLLANL